VNVSWKRQQIPTPVFWPGDFYGHRSLTGCSPRGRKESDKDKYMTLLIQNLKKKKKINEKVKVAQSCPTLCDPLDYSLSGSCAHRSLQARILEWVAVAFSRRRSQPRYQTQVSHIAGGFFTT